MRMKQILEFCKEPRTASGILDDLGLSDRKNLMETYLLTSSLISMKQVNVLYIKDIYFEYG